MTKCTPTCDAEKAVLVEALERERDHWRAALTAWKGSETIDIDYSSALRNESGLTRILANTSPSALLAQGEQARKIVGVLKENGMNLGVVQVPPPILDQERLYALKDAVRAYDRAALAPGEEKE